MSSLSLRFIGGNATGRRPVVQRAEEKTFHFCKISGCHAGIRRRLRYSGNLLVLVQFQGRAGLCSRCVLRRLCRQFLEESKRRSVVSWSLWTVCEYVISMVLQAKSQEKCRCLCVDQVQRLNPLRQLPSDGPCSKALPDFVYDCQGRFQDHAAEDNFWLVFAVRVSNLC